MHGVHVVGSVVFVLHILADPLTQGKPRLVLKERGEAVGSEFVLSVLLLLVRTAGLNLNFRVVVVWLIALHFSNSIK